MDESMDCYNSLFTRALFLARYAEGIQKQLQKRNLEDQAVPKPLIVKKLSLQLQKKSDTNPEADTFVEKTVTLKNDVIKLLFTNDGVALKKLLC